jgi:outer membrane protein assembly factor BamB
MLVALVFTSIAFGPPSPAPPPNWHLKWSSDLESSDCYEDGCAVPLVDSWNATHIYSFGQTGENQLTVDELDFDSGEKTHRSTTVFRSDLDHASTSLLIDSNAVYAVGCASAPGAGRTFGVVQAFNKRSRTLAWSYNSTTDTDCVEPATLFYPDSSSIAAVSPVASVIAVCFGNFLRGLSAESGAVLWTVPFLSCVQPITFGSTFIVLNASGSATTQVVAVNAQTGKSVWGYGDSTKTPVQLVLSVNRLGLLFAVGRSYTLASLDARGGQLQWTVSTNFQPPFAILHVCLM